MYLDWSITSDSADFEVSEAADDKDPRSTFSGRCALSPPAFTPYMNEHLKLWVDNLGMANVTQMALTLSFYIGGRNYTYSASYTTFSPAGTPPRTFMKYIADDMVYDAPRDAEFQTAYRAGETLAVVKTRGQTAWWVAVPSIHDAMSALTIITDGAEIYIRHTCQQHGADYEHL